MLFKEFKLGKIFGIELAIDISWVLIFALVTTNLFVLYSGEYPELAYFHPQIAEIIFVLMALGTSLLFFISLLAHEMGHSLVAIRSGIPVQGITLFLFGGVAKITHEPTKPLQEFLIAIAGPIVSLLLSGLFLLLSLAFPVTSPFGIVFEWLGVINLVLAIFNMLPGFPMDGGRVLRALLWRLSGNLAQATRIASWVGRGFAAILIGFGVLRPFLFAESNLLSGVWMVLIGLYLYYVAYRSGKQSIQMAKLHQHLARELVATPKLSIRSTQNLESIMQALLLTREQPAAAISHGGDVVGILSLTAILETPRDRWATTTAGEIMTPLKQIRSIEAERPVYELITRMNQDANGIFQIIENGTFLGLVTRQELFSFLRITAGFEPG